MRAAHLRVGLDGLAYSGVQLGQVGPGAGGASGHEVDDAKGELVDDFLEGAEVGGEEGVLADEDVQEALVDAEELHGLLHVSTRPRIVCIKAHC